MYSPSAAATSCEISNREKEREKDIAAADKRIESMTYMKIKSQSDKLLYYISDLSNRRKR